LSATQVTDKDAMLALYSSLPYDRRDDVTRALVKQFTGGYKGDALGAMKTLFATLKNDEALPNLRYRGPTDLRGDHIHWSSKLESSAMLHTFLDAGMPLDHVYHIDEDGCPGDYKTGGIDVWYWAILSGSSDVMDELLGGNFKPAVPIATNEDEDEDEVRFLSVQSIISSPASMRTDSLDR
jgi:hypothetical protein